MKTVSVSGSLRENVGKKDARRLRREGLVPCVVYGGAEQVHFITPAKSFKDIVYSPEACLVELDIDGKSYHTILQDIQFHPVDEMILHADFLEIYPDKPVKIRVPVRIAGSSPGVLQGGKLFIKQRKLLIQAIPSDLPDYIEVNISELQIGQSVKVGQLTVDRVGFLDPGHAVVAMVKSTRAAATGASAIEGEEAEGPEGEAPAETPAE